MAFTKIVGAGIHTLSNVHTHNINSSGIITAPQFVGIYSGTDGDFSGNVTIDGNLTVNGNTTTLDTTLQEVDQLFVSANNTTDETSYLTFVDGATGTVKLVGNTIDGYTSLNIGDTYWVQNDGTIGGGLATSQAGFVAISSTKGIIFT